jgi:anti-anti-sigma factor
MLANIGQETIGDVLIVGPNGKLDGNGAKDLENALLSSMDDGATRILFDFSELAYISSSGLRVILVTAKRVKKESGCVALCELNDHIRQVFDMSGFSSILNIESSREAALTAFF